MLVACLFCVGRRTGILMVVTPFESEEFS
jgi:hypothetical protein